MTDKTQEIPSQRGTSSGEIGQNPVEIIGKDTVQAGSKPANDPKTKEEDPSDKG